MKNIEISFGYNGDSKFQKFTYKLCEKYKFLPTFWMRFFSTCEDKKEYFTKKHMIYFDFLSYSYELNYKIPKGKTKYQWKIFKY